MKRILLLLAVGAFIACPSTSKAQNNPPPDPGPPPADAPHAGHHHDLSFLTEAEKAELKKAHDAALAADPSLAAEGKANQEAMHATRWTRP